MPQSLGRRAADPAVGGDRRRRGRKARGLRRSRYMWRYVSPAADHKGKLPETAGRRAMGLRPLRSVLSISKGLCQPVADRSANRWKQRDAKLRGLRCSARYASPAAGVFASDHSKERKKDMKKHFKDLRRRGLALFLVFTLCMSMTLTAFADESAGEGEAQSTTQTDGSGGDVGGSPTSGSAASETADTDTATSDPGPQTESGSTDKGANTSDGSDASETSNTDTADPEPAARTEDNTADQTEDNTAGQTGDKSVGGEDSGADEPAISVTVDTDTPAPGPDQQAGQTSVDNGDGTTTVVDITENVWDTEGGTGKSETTTSVTTDAEGNVQEESTHVTGSETTKENAGGTTSEESGVGNVSVTVKPEGTGEGTADADAILGSIRPDTSGEGWSQNEDGSFSKTEDTENGQCVTTVTNVKDESGKTIGYTTQTVTTTVETTPTVFEAPEAGVKENEDGSRTTVTVERDENGVVTGYTEVTEVLNEAGVVVSSVTKTVSGSGTATVTTTTTATKTQTVDPDTSSKVTVDMSGVTEGEKHGDLHTNGLEITDKPEEGNDLLDPTDKEGVIKLEDLEDDDLVFVSGIGLVSKYNLTIMYTQNKNGGWYKYNKGWPVKQYIVKDKDGKEHPVYCADMSVVTENAVKYYLENTEDADYYTNPNNNQKDPDGGWHLREIATNGYWGTAEGMGSLTELVDKLLAAKKEGNVALESLTEEQIRSLTEGQALAATQAAIWKYGNSLSLNPFVLEGPKLTTIATENSKLEYDPETGIIKRITTTYDKETGKTTITTEETKVSLPDGLEITVERDPETGEVVKISYPKYYPAYIKLLQDGWLDNPNGLHSLVGSPYHKDDEEVQLIEAVYKYLTTLEKQEDTTTDLIQPSDIVEAVTNVNTAVGKDEDGRDVYDADVSFVLTVEQSRLNGDLLVNVYDSKTGALITTRRVAGDDSKDDPSIGKTIAHVSDKGITYTIDGIQLANGQTIRLNLVGSQEVKKGAYLITAQTGYKNNQTFVGVEEGYRDVDLNFELTLNVAPGTINSVENKEVASEKTWDEDKKVIYNYYELDIPEGPGPDPTPDPTPTPDRPTTSIRRHRDPSTSISNEPTPLADIPEAEVPLAAIPEAEVPLATLVDEDVPLASVPKTGDISSLWYVLLALSGIGLLGMAINGKKSKESASN